MSEELSNIDLTPMAGKDEEPCAATYCRTCRRFLYIGFTSNLLGNADPGSLNYLRAGVAIDRAKVHTAMHSGLHHVQVVQGNNMIYEKNEPPQQPSASEYIWFSYLAENNLH